MLKQNFNNFQTNSLIKTSTQNLLEILLELMSTVTEMKKLL